MTTFSFGAVVGSTKTVDIPVDTTGATSATFKNASTNEVVGTCQVLTGKVRVYFKNLMATWEYVLDLNNRPGAVTGKVLAEAQVHPSAVSLSSDAASKAVAEGRFFISGKTISLGGALSAERACMKLANPANSGKTLSVVKLSIYSNVTQQIQYLENATLTSPTTMTNHNMLMGSSNASVGVTSHATAFSGGTKWGNESRVESGAAAHIPLPPLIVPPGQSFVIAGTSSAAQTLTANVYWIETAV